MELQQAQEILGQCRIVGGFTAYGIGASYSGVPNKYVYNIYPPIRDEQNRPLTKEAASENNKQVIEALHAFYPIGVTRSQVVVIGSAKHPESQIISVVSDTTPYFLALLSDVQKTVHSKGSAGKAIKAV